MYKHVDVCNENQKAIYIAKYIFKKILSIAIGENSFCYKKNKFL